jgi:hypothetical protein
VGRAVEALGGDACRHAAKGLQADHLRLNAFNAIRGGPGARSGGRLQASAHLRLDVPQLDRASDSRSQNEPVGVQLRAGVSVAAAHVQHGPRGGEVQQAPGAIHGCADEIVAGGLEGQAGYLRGGRGSGYGVSGGERRVVAALTPVFLLPPSLAFLYAPSVLLACFCSAPALQLLPLLLSPHSHPPL